MKRIIYILTACITLLCACEKEIKFNGDYDGEKLVLFSFANPDSVLTAKLFKSTFILSHESPGRLNQISGAHVWAEVNEKYKYDFRERITEYRYDYGDEWSVQVVIDYISDYQPKPGDHIVVHASHQNFKEVYGETVVPQRPDMRVSPVEFKEDKKDPGSMIRACVDVTINDPAETDDYYSLNMAVKSIPDEYYLSEWSWMRVYSEDVIFYKTGVGDFIDSIEGMENEIPEYFDDGAFGGEAHRFNIWSRIYVGDGEEYCRSIAPSDIKVVVDNMSESLYRYCKSRDAAENTGGFGSIFGEQVSIYNNIVNGIGCVGAIAGTEMKLE